MNNQAIAIVGMAGRFPGARNLTEFWRNLRDGVETVRRLSDAELLAAGVHPDELADADYVKAGGVLEDVDMFDASFFNLNPRDASIMDPQHRHFLECAWEVLEDAGHPPQDFQGSIGVFAGSGTNSYLIYNLLANRQLRQTAGLFQLKQTGNDKDVLSTRVSYQFNLRGPSINVQTACSSSLVAVHLACQSLLNQECDMALAGGVTIEIPHGHGYLYREGEILSRDGHCRAFDAASSGTVFGSGVGIVVLRRLEDAIEDRDHIRAVILGSAINNDGARKVGFLAPSVDGQAEVISEALGVAGLTADEISYVETHGTGTAVGDPIEIRALAQAFRQSSSRSGYCGIGSLKTNVGHLDAAAGVAGLIKTALALENRRIPASLNFRTPNPLIEFKNSPFFVNSQLADWTANGAPRRAGVTSLGIGGTNAHVVLEEAPPTAPAAPAKPYQLLTVSAKTETAVQRACTNLAAHIQEHPELSLADVAFTCQLGRQALPYRRTVVAQDVLEASRALMGDEGKQPAPCPPKAPGVAFMFSGQGSQYVNMGRELYETEAVFRTTLDHCAERLKPHLGVDLRQALYPPQDDFEASSQRLNETWLTQPALFAVEYSLAQWWMSLGLHPQAMVGHSIGEYVAACLAQVFSLDDALDIIAFRGRQIYDLPSGSMLAIPLAPEEVRHNGNISIAAVNNPRQCVASGETSSIEELEKSLAGRSVVCRRLHTSHAFHSAMMDPVLDRFVQRIQQIALRPPQIPYLSNVTGTWIHAEEATDPRYWARHLRQTVRFSDCLDELLREPDRILLEIGPGQTLASLARQHSPHGAKVFQSLRHPQEKTSDLRFALRTLGDMWVRGAQIDWTGLHSVDSARRVSLPPYPFDHRRFWVNPDTPSPNTEPSPAPAPAPEDGIEQWFYRRVWNRSDLKSTPLGEAGTWILFQDAAGLGDRIASELKANRQKAIRIATGPGYQRLADGNYTIRPGVRSDYDALITDILKSGPFPKHIIHFWSVLPAGTHPPLDEVVERSFYSPLFLSQALADQDIGNLDLAFVSNTMQSVAGEPTEDPARAVLLGPVRVIPKELPGITCRAIDVEIGKGDASRCATEILAELAASPNDTVVAYRHGERFIEAVEPFSPVAGRPRLLAKGVYLVTGGLGGIGLAVAEHLARNFQARLVLVGRSVLPPETEWEACLKQENESESTRNKIRTLLELKSHGAEFLIAQADVTKPDEVRNVVDLARQRFGEITGVFHAAGTIEDQPLMLKTVESAARVLGSKVRGTLVLEEVLRGSPLSCFVLFSSISSILPPAGQIDYAAANAFLDAFALSRKGTVTAIDWGLWRDVGMGRASSHPLLGQRLVETAEETLYSSRLSPQNWLLAEHRLKDGRALIPGTGYLEWAAAALHRGSLLGGVAFEDVHFLAPLTFDRAESKASRVRLRREGEAFRFSILSQDGDWIEHATGSISRLTAAPPRRLDRLEITSRCGDGEIVFDEVHRTKQERYFDFGPRWRSLKKIRLGERECLAELELNESLRGDCSSWRMHPALLDMATGCALYLTRGYETTRDLYLPVFYKRIRCYSQIPPKVFSHILSRGENVGGGAVAVFDITLFDELGQVLVEIEGFTMRLIADPPSISGSAKATARGVRENRSALEDGDRLAIPVSDGVQSLVRLLHADTPPIVVISPQNPIVQKPSVKAATPAPSDSSLPSSEVEASQVEATIVGWWRELLGIERIELDDDFFDLGGHSLIAVRLFSKIKKTYHVDLGLAAIFEARTIRKLAALIRNSSSPVGAQDKAWSPLVPIQPNGSRTPLFLVHALGPSVLFYEELAKSLPPDQPVYGLQSPLASPQQPRPGRVEELAGIYLDEIQRFLPNGPYLLGGLSFGGMIAMEMSLQLYKQGKKPGLLLLLDAFVPGSNLRVAGRDQVTEHWHNIRRRGGSYIWEKLKGKIDYFGSRITERAALAMARCYRLAGISLPDRLHTLQVEQSHREIMQRYVIQPYPGRITLMRAIDVHRPVGERRDPANGWQQFAGGGIDIHDVPGGHNSMLIQPHAKIVADELKKVLPS